MALRTISSIKGNYLLEKSATFTPQNDLIHILIADDHAAVREGLTAVLKFRCNMDVIAEAADGSEALAQYRRHRPDITLMDMSMPKMNGLEATSAILSEFPGARIILLTAFDGVEVKARAAGAKAVILKEASYDELSKIIREVHDTAVLEKANDRKPVTAAAIAVPA